METKNISEQEMQCWAVKASKLETEIHMLDEQLINGKTFKFEVYNALPNWNLNFCSIAWSTPVKRNKSENIFI